ncbi:hypothetical protein ACTFIZ_008205 [Dictyostelium cf. discoideum]
MNNENIESMDIEPPPLASSSSSLSSSIYPNFNKEELKLWVGSLPDEVTELELREFFSKYSINEIKLTENSGTQKQNAFVTFFDKESANRAREELSQQLFKNQRLKINWASVKPQKYSDMPVTTTTPTTPPPLTTTTTISTPPHHISQLHTKTIHMDPYNSLGHYGTGIHHHYTHPQPPQTFSTGYHSVYYGNKEISGKDSTTETNSSVNINNKASPPTPPTTVSPPQTTTTTTTTTTLVPPPHTHPHTHPHPHPHPHPHSYPYSHQHHPPIPIPIPLHHHPHHPHHPSPPPPPPHSSLHHHSHHPKIISDNDPYVNKKLFLGSLNDEPEEEVRYRFSRFGEIDCFDLTNKGVAFVRYLKTESAIIAKRELGYRYKIQYDKREPRDHYHFDPNGPSSFISSGASHYYGPDYYSKQQQQQPPLPPSHQQPLSSSTSSSSLSSSSSSHPTPQPPLPPIPPTSSSSYTFYNEPLSTEEYNQFLLFLEKLQPIRQLIKESKDWFILHLKSGKPIIQLMSKYINNQLTLTTVQNKIEIIYLINDILYFGVSRRGSEQSDQISDLFEPFLPIIITSFSKEPIQNQQKLLHVLDIWDSRYFYPFKVIQHFKNLLK